MNYIPTHVQIETVNRFCDARCPMCTIKFVPDHAKDAPDDLSNNGKSRAAEIMKPYSNLTIILSEQIKKTESHGTKS